MADETPMSDPTRTPEEIAAGQLSAAGRRIVLETNPEAGPRRLNDVHLQAWGRLYNQGVVSYLRAGGYTFFDLTPLGLAVKAILEKDSRHV